MQDLWHNLDYDARSKESFLVLILKDEYFSLSAFFSLSLFRQANRNRIIYRLAGRQR